jgi:anti-sigma B factor antagonist
MVKTEISDGFTICSFDQTSKLNAVNSEEVKAEINRHFEKSGTKLILDLGNIDFIDSSGFGVLLSVMKNAKNNSGTFAICCIKPNVMALFKLLQLHNVFHLQDTVEEAKYNSR